MLPIIEGYSFRFYFLLIKPLCAKIQATFECRIYSNVWDAGNKESRADSVFLLDRLYSIEYVSEGIYGNTV